MELKILVRLWFQKWEEGEFENIPIEENFKHTSPYGTVDSKRRYLNLVEANKDAFLGKHFDIHDEIYEQNRACVRYTLKSEDTALMEVSEWFYMGKDKIQEIVSYYNVGEDVSYEKKFSKPK